MRKIEKYNTQLRDQDIINPSQLFDPFVPTGKKIPTDNTLRIESTEQNLYTAKISEQYQFTQTDILSPKSNSQFNPHETSALMEDKGLNRLKWTGNKKNFHAFSNSVEEKCVQMMRKRKKWEELKDVLTNQKINVLRQIFIQKIKRNNPFSPPVQFEIADDYKKESFLDESGIEFSQHTDHILSFILIAQIMLSLFVYTLALAFEEVSESTTLFVFQTVSITVSLLEMTINFIHQKTVSGRKVKSLREIIKHYTHNHLFIDSVNIAALILSMSTKIAIFGFFRLIIISKFPQILERLEKLEIYIIDNYYNEQYWSLIKTIIFNFCFAHMLAILLVGMTNLNDKLNWMIVKNIHQSPWFERYIWSYYWGTNIMLTVGFGDIVASTYQEAICLIFIETISCLALAYNINCVGSLISNIRAQDIQKSKNFKIFKKLIVKNNLPEDLSWRINNYIQESINIKKKFSLEEEKNFIEKLPNGFKREVLKESNKNIFDKLAFFHNLMQKTLYSLAEKIEMCIYHPQQIIQPLEDNYSLYILKAGQIGYVSKRNESNHFNKVIDIKKTSQQENPFLINLHFITKKRLNFEVKSLVYSILYYLDHNKLIDILEESPMDYQLYSYLRDKNKNVIDEFQVFPCQYCKTKHTKFFCPKIHYIPITQHVINKYLRAYSIGKNKRSKDVAIRRRYEHTLVTYQYLEDYHIKNREIDPFESKRTEKSRRIAENIRRNRLLSDHFVEQSLKLQQSLIDHTTEIIREQFVKLMGTELFEDQIWNLSLDKMKNYKSYFSQDNSSNLKQKFNCEKRRSKLFEKFKTAEELLEQKYIYGNEPSNQFSSRIPMQLKEFTELNQRSISD